MNAILSWVLAVLCAVLVVGMIAYARGHEHHHGDDVGAAGLPVVVMRGTTS